MIVSIMSSCSYKGKISPNCGDLNPEELLVSRPHCASVYRYCRPLKAYTASDSCTEISNHPTSPWGGRRTIVGRSTCSISGLRGNTSLHQVSQVILDRDPMSWNVGHSVSVVCLGSARRFSSRSLKRFLRPCMAHHPSPDVVWDECPWLLIKVKRIFGKGVDSVARIVDCGHAYSRTAFGGVDFFQ